MPTTVILSVMLTFSSVPSRDLTVSVFPSTASMVPRMRTGCGFCASADAVRTSVVASEATSRRGIHDISFDISLVPSGLLQQTIGQTPGANTYSASFDHDREGERRPGQARKERANRDDLYNYASAAEKLHRRCQPIATHADAVGIV